MPCERPGRFRRLLRAVRRLLPGFGGFEPPDYPPWPDEPSLVPTGPPRRRPPSSAVALELPTEPDPLVYPTDVEAVGEPLPSAGTGEDVGRRWRSAWLSPARWLRRSLPVG